MRRFLTICITVCTSGLSAFGYTNVLENEASQTITNGWDALGDMVVGEATSSNRLTISLGGSLTNVNGYVGRQASAGNNQATVTGTNSLWYNSGSLTIGGAGSNSTLTVNDSGSVFVEQDFFLQNSSRLELASAGRVTVEGNVTIEDSTVAGVGSIILGGLDNDLIIRGSNTVIEPGIVFDGGAGTDRIQVTDWTFTVSANVPNQYLNFENLMITDGVLAGAGTLNAFNTTGMDGGRIAPTGDLVIENTFNVAGAVTLQLTAGATSLRVTDPAGLDISGMVAEISVSPNVDPRTFNGIVLSADNGLNGAFASTTLSDQFLLYDFALSNAANTVSVSAEAVADGSIGSTLAYGGIQGIRAGFNGMHNAAFVRTKQLRRNGVATDYAISQTAYELSSTNAPAGPRGPGDQNTIFGMHFWAQHFNGQGDYDSMGLSEGFTLNNNGTSFGFDRLLGADLVVGVNYTYARSIATVEDGDRVETETYWLGLYSEWANQNDYYAEGLLAIGWSDYATIRRQVGYTGEAQFEGADFGAHAEVGKYFHTRHWALAPYVGMDYLGIQSDAYTETAGGNTVSVSEQSIASLESAVGIKLRHRFDTRAGRFQTIGYLEWVYDWINDDIGSTLSDGTTAIRTARIAPVASLLNAGLGLSWICTDYLEIGLSYDGRFNDNYNEHMISALLEVRF